MILTIIKARLKQSGSGAAINERLIEAAKVGSEAELKSLLCEPGCKALTPDVVGMTALMWASFRGSEACVRLLLPISNARAKSEDGQAALTWAAYPGHEACVRLLLPVSDVLGKDKAGRTASSWAKKERHESLAKFIDAYALSQAEQASIDGAISPATSRKRASPRV